MALAERLSVKRKSGSRSSSQSSVETESNGCDRFSVKSNPCQSPMSLAQIIASTYKHSPNLLIPHPALLKLLKTVGAKGERYIRDTEIYTVQQLCHYLKEYIKQRQLYDVNDVQVVHCRDDPLGDVFHVDRFTVYNVLDLISKASTPLLLSPSKNKISISSDSKTSDLQKVKQGGTWKPSDDGAGAATDCTEKPGYESSPKRSASSVNLSKLFCRYGAHGNELTCNFVTSTTDSVRIAGLKRSVEEEEDVECPPEKRPCLEKTSSAEAREDNFENNEHSIEKEVLEQQLLLRVRDNSATLGDVSDVESIYSIQSKETAVVKDSSDDLWFLKDDDDVERDTDDYDDIYADEFDILSDISHGTSSEVDEDDIDVFSEREDIIVICDGSETEFADGELSDIEEEVASQFSRAIERNSWQCIKCSHRNRTPDRLCDECLNLRTEELNQEETSANPGSCTRETPPLTLPVTDDYTSDRSTAGNRELDHQCCHSENNTCVGGFIGKSFESLPSTGKSFDSSPWTGKTFDSSIGKSVGSSPSSGKSFDSSPLTGKSFDSSPSTGKSFDSSSQFASSQESGFISADLDDEATPRTSSFNPLTTERTEAEGDVTALDASQTHDGKVRQTSISLNSCIICLSEPKVASLVHGTSGHQVCCYQCACQLKRMHKPCPVCRRPIQKVIRNYVV